MGASAQIVPPGGGPNGLQLPNGTYDVYDGGQQIGSAKAEGAGTSGPTVTFRNNTTGEIYTWDGSKYTSPDGQTAIIFGTIGETWYWAKYQLINGVWVLTQDGHLA